MMKKAILLAYIIFASTNALTATSDYIWPMKLRPELTSRFCDYRAGHFHGGLDIRTGGRIGVPIYAIADGYVFRVATSFRGYGKALYLKLKDDRIIVFGHLSAFYDPVDERVRSAQLRDKKYIQDLYFTSSELPVKKGQLIAYSGESGTEAPHLHFEMRSPQNNPINPLESGYSMADKMPPEFDNLAIRYYKHGFNPGDPCEIEFLPVVKNVNGYTITDTIVSDDNLALAVAGGDRIDNGGFFYSYFGLRLSVDDSLLFQMESDSLSYSTTRQLNYVRDLELIRLFTRKNKTDNDQGIFYRLYVPPRANQYFWPGFSDKCGVITPISKPGIVRKIKIEAFDESGNRALLTFYLKSPDLERPEFVSYRHSRDTLLVEFVTAMKVKSAEVRYRNEASQAYKSVKCSISSQASSDKAQNQIRFKAPVKDAEYRFCYRDERNGRSPWIYFHEAKTDDKFYVFGAPDFLSVKCAAQSRTARLRITCGGETNEFEMVTDGPNCFSVDILNSSLKGSTRFTIIGDNDTVIDTNMALYPVAPSAPVEFSSPDSTIAISVQSNSAYYPSYVMPSNAVKKSIPAGAAIIYDIQPDIMLVDAPVKYSFNLVKLGLTGKKVGVYGSNASDDWNFIGKTDGAKLEVNGFGLGKLALLEDNDPPIISAVSPSGVVKSRTPNLSCILGDRISGLALDNGLSMTIDGVWVPAEYDIDGSRYSYKVRTPLKDGKHKLEIKASDNQGNIAIKTIDFTVSAK